jgi:hypothetical protein
MLMTLWMMCYMFQCFIIKIDSFKPKEAGGALALIVVFVILCFLPIHVFYLRTRKELLRTLMHIVISPFGPVKFKDFFLADIITSLNHTLRDFVTTVFFFASN